MEPSRFLTPSAIHDLISNGNLIVIVDGRVLRLDDWINKHPGGRLVIQHMIGRDATEEVNIYHSCKALHGMKSYSIGRIDGSWTNLTPPIRGGVFPRTQCPSLKKHTTLQHTTDPTDFPLPTCCITGRTNKAPSNPDSLTSLRPPSARDQNKDGRDDDEKDSRTSHPTIIPAHVYSPGAYPSTDDYTRDEMQREIEDGLRNYPSLDASTQQDIALKYQALHQRVKDEGLYTCRHVEYAKEFVRCMSLFLLFLAALRYEWYMTSAGFLGLFWHQIMFTAHDAGHRGITHNFFIDTLIGIVVADFCCGLSLGWWKSSHNVHHLVTNHPEHDPDIQNIPLFATCPSFFKSLRSTYYDFTFVWDAFAQASVQYQAYTYYPVMALARFNLYFLSICHLCSPRAHKPGIAAWIHPTELAFMALYWLLFGYLLVWRTIPTWPLRVAFVLISHIITMPLHVQITLSHWGMPTADLGEAESFPQRQLRTTMDVDCPAWLDFVHGGLQFQACHHLFPMVPRHNLRRLQVLVCEFCAETGIPYKILGFVDGNRQVLGRLGMVGRQVEFLVKCQRYMSETGESGLM